MVINIKKNIIKLLFMLSIFLTFNTGEIDSNSDKILYYDRDLEIIPENYKIYWLSVDNTTTYANSIYPGDKIDLWLLTKVENNYVYEPFITNIEVLSYIIDGKKYYARNIEELINVYTKDLNDELKVYYKLHGIRIEGITAVCKVYDLIKLEKLERIY